MDQPEEHPNGALVITEKPSWISIEDYSNWFKLLKVVAYILRFLKQRIWLWLSNTFKKRFPVTSLIFNNIKDSSFISAKEQQSAEIFLVRLEQQRLFDKQFSAIARKTKEGLMDQLGLYKNNGILRCAGRYIYRYQKIPNTHC